MKIKKILLVAIVSFVFFNGCDDNSTNPGNQPANEIWIQNNAFVPASLTISAGTTVTWVNKDAVTHTATSGTGTPSGTFNSGNMSTNQTFSFTFESASTYAYYCMLHPAMTGSIIVQ